MTTVVNKRHEDYDVYIGRGSLWGNPYMICIDGDREEVIEEYRHYLWRRLQNGTITVSQLRSLYGKRLGCYCKPLPCHGDVLVKAAVWALTQFSWTKFGGYEVTTKGDVRFSAFNAIMPDGRSIEQHYHCDVKGYDPGGTNWRKGKGKPPLNPETDLWGEYLKMWKVWAKANPELIEELRQHALKHDNTLSDMFATTEINQAHALAVILSGG